MATSKKLRDLLITVAVAAATVHVLTRSGMLAPKKS
jgi:hypothetical protein